MCKCVKMRKYRKITVLSRKNTGFPCFLKQLKNSKKSFKNGNFTAAKAS